MSASQDLLPDAFSTVLGVASAKLHSNPADVELLLSGYRADAKALGYSDETAWGVLFAASASWMTTLIECSAAHHNVTPAQRTQELARNLAGVP